MQWWCYTMCWQKDSSLTSIWTICQKNLISLENFLLQNVPPQMPASWLRLGLVLVTGPQGGWGPGAGGCQPIRAEYWEAVTNERRVLSECGEHWRAGDQPREPVGGLVWPDTSPAPRVRQREEHTAWCHRGHPQTVGTRDKPSRLGWYIGFIHWST